jgi:hypothetical protein
VQGASATSSESISRLKSARRPVSNTSARVTADVDFLGHPARHPLELPEAVIDDRNHRHVVTHRGFLRHATYSRRSAAFRDHPRISRPIRRNRFRFAASDTDRAVRCVPAKATWPPVLCSQKFKPAG